MTRRAALVAVALAMACRHARKAQPPEPPQAQEQTGRAEGIPARKGRPAVPATPRALLGEKDLAEVQKALAGRGLLREHREGQLDDPTAQALEKFQRREGLAATGFPDRATVRRLGLDPEHMYRPEQRVGGTGTGSGAGSGAGTGSGSGSGTGDRP
jgi:murein L,D-transpeptidase YcbB/YkuD